MSKHNRWKYLAILPAAFLVSACSVTPTLKQPSIPKEGGYVKGDELVSMNQKIVLGNRIASDWWTLFASKPLNALIRKAVENNFDLAAARESVKQAQEAANAADGSLMPQVSLNAQTGRQKYGVAMFGPSNFSIPPFAYYEVGPSISWTPDFFGAERHAVERQKALAAYQVHQLDAAYLSLTGNTVAETLAMASIAEEIAAVKRILTADKITLSLVEDAYAVGTASKPEVLSAKTKLLRDQAMLPSLEGRMAASRHALSILVGKAPSKWTPPEIALRDISMPKKLPLSLPSDLVKRRPDILAAKANLDAAAASVGVADADLYPSITLTANMVQEALTPAGVFRGAATAWALATGVSAPIFDGGTLSAKKREAKHAYGAALAQYRQTILNAFGDVADALSSLAHDDEAVSTLQSATEAASNTLGLALDSYRVGEIGLMQVQDAQRDLAQAELDLVRSRHQRYLDCVRLFIALGGGAPWQS